jgi:putative hydrolase of the HAD superfamily
MAELTAALARLAGTGWVLFDAVGTLIAPDPPVAEVYRGAAERFGSRLDLATIWQRFRQALAEEHAAGEPTSEPQERERWRRIVGRVIDDVPAASDALFQQLWNHFAQPQSWRLYDDVTPALAALAAHGYRWGIASNFDARLKGIVRASSALTGCEAVFVSSEIGFTKPDRRFFREVQLRLGAAAAEIVLVGDDAASDVAGATAAGWRAVLLDRNKSPDMPPGKSVIGTLTELI